MVAECSVERENLSGCGSVEGGDFSGCGFGVDFLAMVGRKGLHGSSWLVLNSPGGGVSLLVLITSGMVECCELGYASRGPEEAWFRIPEEKVRELMKFLCWQKD